MKINKLNTLKYYRIFYKLVFVVSIFLIGMIFKHYNQFPSKYIIDLDKFIKGHPEEDKSLEEKLFHELNFVPVRGIYDNESLKLPKKYKKLKIDKIKKRRFLPEYFIEENSLLENGYIISSGNFDLKYNYNDFLLVGKNFNHTWNVNNNELKRFFYEQGKKDIYADTYFRGPPFFDILSDGSIIFSGGFFAGRVDFCGEWKWIKEGSFHHGVSIDNEEKFVWVIFEDTFQKLNIINGNVVKEISLINIIKNNPDINIFDLRKVPYQSRYLYDPYHINDVEEIPKNYLSYFSIFDEGDLVISLRSANLIFVVDEETLKIKWWRVGLGKRQHDPDWQKGYLTFFNNNMKDENDEIFPKKFLEIKKINLKNMKSEKIFDGRNLKLYTSMEGTHDVHGDRVIITSSRQGRILEYDYKEDKFYFDFINSYNSEKNYLITESKFKNKNFFKEDPKNLKKKCK